MPRWLAAVAACVLLVGCGRPSLDTVVREAGVSVDAVVRLDDGRAVAARRNGPLVQVLDFRTGAEGWHAEDRAAATSPRAGSVNAVSGGGDRLDAWPTFVFGAAPPGVARVVIADIHGVGGQVVDGAWVVASPVEDLQAGEVSWQFLDADGRTVLSGEGLYQAP